MPAPAVRPLMLVNCCRKAGCFEVKSKSVYRGVKIGISVIVFGFLSCVNCEAFNSHRD